MENSNSNKKIHDKLSKEFFTITDTEKASYLAISNKLKPIFQKVLQEAKQNRISVGGSVVTTPSRLLYNPHNCRLFFDFSKGGKIPFEPTRTDPPKNCIYRVVNKTEHSFKGFFDCTIRVRKNTIEIANMINSKWYHIDITTDSKEQIIKIVQEKTKECEKILKEFIKLFGGSSQKIIKNIFVKDNKIQGEEGIDQFHEKTLFNNQVGKKDYNEKLFEFKTPIQASNYIETRAIESIAPDISHGLKTIALNQNALWDNLESTNPLRVLKTRVKSVDDIITNKRLIKALTKPEVKDFERWIFINIANKRATLCQ